MNKQELELLNKYADGGMLFMLDKDICDEVGEEINKLLQENKELRDFKETFCIDWKRFKSIADTIEKNNLPYDGILMASKLVHKKLEKQKDWDKIGLDNNHITIID